MSVDLTDDTRPPIFVDFTKDDSDAEDNAANASESGLANIE
jgi:hypothetical protein